MSLFDINPADLIYGRNVVGESGGGLVRVIMNSGCDLVVREVEIAQEAFDQGKEFVEDLLVAAINSAHDKAFDEIENKVTELSFQNEDN